MSVIDFPGPKDSVDPETVLEGAKGLDSFIVIGWRDNDFVMLNTDNDGPGVLFLLELAKRSVMNLFIGSVE